MADTFEWRDGRTVKHLSGKEKTALVRATLKQEFPGVTFSITTEGRGTAFGWTRVRWESDRYSLDWNAVRKALEPFEDDVEPMLLDGEWVWCSGGIWCGPK